jgi:hypothetical protein
MRTYSLHHQLCKTLRIPYRNSYVVWEGPSPVDGKTINLTLTGFKTPTSNEKTGDMIQSWIMLKETPPGKAMRTGADKSVCGNCACKPSLDGDCYVGARAPSSVFRGYTPVITIEQARVLLEGRKLRCGSYGDPAMLPYEIWIALGVGKGGSLKGWTMYTHQWKEPFYDERYKAIAMYSVDNKREALKALVLGARYFRAGTEKMPQERLCLAEDKGLSCATCLLCNGDRGMTKTGARARTSIFIEAHGYLMTRETSYRSS